MPITVGALRKLRADKKKTAANLRVKKALKAAALKFRKKKSSAGLTELYRRADRAAKTGVIKKGRADRIKSRAAATWDRKK